MKEFAYSGAKDANKDSEQLLVREKEAWLQASKLANQTFSTVAAKLLAE